MGILDRFDDRMKKKGQTQPVDPNLQNVLVNLTSSLQALQGIAPMAAQLGVQSQLDAAAQQLQVAVNMLSVQQNSPQQVQMTMASKKTAGWEDDFDPHWTPDKDKPLGGKFDFDNFEKQFNESVEKEESLPEFKGNPRDWPPAELVSSFVGGKPANWRLVLKSNMGIFSVNLPVPDGGDEKQALEVAKRYYKGPILT